MGSCKNKRKMVIKDINALLGEIIDNTENQNLG